MTTPWELRFANRTQRMKSSFIRELLKVTNQPDVISFGGGFPPLPNFSRSKKAKKAAEKVLDLYGRKALQYTTTEGYDPPARVDRGRCP